jgi:IS605 OrfB family transposase
MPILSYKTKLIINQNDKNKLLSLLELERTIWNECSKTCFFLDKRNINTLHKSFYFYVKELFKNTPAQLIIEVERSVLAAYASAQSNKHKITKPFIKKKLSFQFDNRSFNYKNNLLKFISLEKRKMISCDFEKYPLLLDKLKYKFTPPKLLYKNNELIIVLSFNIPNPELKQSKVLGIDLGCINSVATSEGLLYNDKTYLKNKRKIRYLKRCLNSKNTKSAKKHLKKVKNKEANVTKDYIHRLTKQVLNNTNCDVIAIENLNVKQLKSKKYKNQNKNRIGQVPFSLFIFVITYKALLLGKQVITVSPYYTSQIDSTTGKKDGKRKGGRYVTKSGKVFHADVNAACNICKRHIEKLPQHPCSIIVPYNNHARQAAINQPIVTKLIKSI